MREDPVVCDACGFVTRVASPRRVTDYEDDIRACPRCSIPYAVEAIVCLGYIDNIEKENENE